MEYRVESVDTYGSLVSLYLNTLCLIFLLFRLQGQLDEKLLQLLIAVVYAELFKTNTHTHKSKHMHTHTHAPAQTKNINVHNTLAEQYYFWNRILLNIIINQYYYGYYVFSILL